MNSRSFFVPHLLSHRRLLAIAIVLGFQLLFGLVLTASTVFAEDLNSKDQLRAEVAQAVSIPLMQGDRCLVGGIPIDHQSGVGMLLRGRRVTVSKMKIEEFKQNPERYFTQLQPKAALFTEATEQLKPNMGWTIFGIVIVALVLLAGLSSAAAIRYGQDPRKWFMVGLCGNILAPLTVRGRGQAITEMPKGYTKILRTALPVVCPNCGFDNHPTADLCGSCGSKLEPKYQSEAKLSRSID